MPTIRALCADRLTETELLRSPLCRDGSAEAHGRRVKPCTAGALSQVADTLAEIHERHEAVKELEKSLLDLHQIFLDMAVLVEAQGEMLDNIGAQARCCRRRRRRTGMSAMRSVCA